MWHGRVMAGHGTHNKEIVCLTHSNSMYVMHLNKLLTHVSLPLTKSANAAQCRSQPCPGGKEWQSIAGFMTSHIWVGGDHFKP